MKERRVSPVMVAMVAWLCILGVFTYWFELFTRREERQMAMSTANAFFQQLLISRQWNASHAGVYVPITGETPPNPYLPRHLRELTADNGLRLTRINPAYMTRQMAQLAARRPESIQFRITSLNPLRPENRATGWEAGWLRSFAEGAKEQGEFYDDGETTWFRFMAPLTVTPECLKCHSRQGHKEGDIRGGLSITMPYPRPNHLPLVAGLGAVAVVGLAFIIGFGSLYERKRRLFKAAFNSPIPTCLTGADHTILQANEAYWHEFGPLPDHRKSIKCHEHRPGKSCHTERCPLSQIMAGASQYICEPSKEKEDGETQYFIVTAKPFLDSRDRVIGVVESFQDITGRKRMEKELEGANRALEALSITDALTGISNRRRFDEALAQEYARHIRSGADLSLIMLDLDHFKPFNDCYGHPAGDECLRRVAQVITAFATRPADLAARYGGEEFACILPETDSSGALAIADEIRRGIAALAIPHRESKGAGHVTASLGVATAPCTSAGAPGDLIALADEQLYLAKAAGRNRVKFTAIRTEGETTSGIVQLTWKDSFSCGHQLLDSQHKSLLQSANRLLEAVLTARPAPEIASLLAKLLAEIDQHFQDEEAVLREANFPGLDKHIEDHARLLAQGQQLAKEFAAGTLTAGAVFQFLASEAIMLHMLEADREYFPIIARREGADRPAENPPEGGNVGKQSENQAPGAVQPATPGEG